MLKFTKTLEVIVPNHKNHGVALTPVERARIDKKIDSLTRTVGGVTWYDTNGRWFDGQGQAYDDSHRTYQWFIENDLSTINRNTILSKFDELLSTIFRESEQHSITVKMNGTSYITHRVSFELLATLDKFMMEVK